MSYNKIRDLTVFEFVALTFTHFGHRSFTLASQTYFLSSFLTESFTVGHVKAVEDLNSMALYHGLIRECPSSTGGVNFEVTEQGVDETAEIELPHDIFERRGQQQEERGREAHGNAGPVFEALLRASAEKDAHGHVFIEKIFKHWLAQGWLSSKQVTAISQIGHRCGVFVHPTHYIGSAFGLWTAPYIEKQRLEQAATQAAHNARVLAQREEIAEKARVRTVTRVENRQTTAAIKEIAIAGGLAELDALVTDVFPNVKCDETSKALAFSGGGSNELRVCVAMVAFGKPPSLLWRQSRNRKQPDAESGLWQTLMAHATGRAILARHDQATMLAESNRSNAENI
ncbi:hypothetical protein [Massilia sp. TWP1-3-3]|uniref:hypothetical protein n=1 Tax=Massilia sp. TWP1-3-3 TaxID=2804573 RepID=UPI003CEE4B02